MTKGSTSVTPHHSYNSRLKDEPGYAGTRCDRLFPFLPRPCLIVSQIFGGEFAKQILAEHRPKPRGHKRHLTTTTRQPNLLISPLVSPGPSSPTTVTLTTRQRNSPLIPKWRWPLWLYYVKYPIANWTSLTGGQLIKGVGRRGGRSRSFYSFSGTDDSNNRQIIPGSVRRMTLKARVWLRPTTALIWQAGLWSDRRGCGWSVAGGRRWMVRMTRNFVEGNNVSRGID